GPVGRLHAGGRAGVGDLRVGDDVDQVGDAGGEGTAQRRTDVRGFGHELAGAPQGAHHLVVPAARLQVGGDVVAVQGAHRMPLQAPAGVVPADHDHGQPVPD